MRSMKTVPARLWFLSGLSAVLQLLPFPLAGPVPLWRRALCWFCLAPLLVALLSRDRNGGELRPSQAAMVGYFCGFLWFMGNCYWVFQTMHLYGGIPLVPSFGILVLFSLYLGLYFGLCGWLVGLLRAHLGMERTLFAAPFLWVSVEFARSRITGFPWDLMGYTQIDNAAVAHIAVVTGVFGLSFLVATVNGLWAAKFVLPAHRLSRWFLPLAILLSVSLSLLGLYRPARKVPSAELSAVLLQENLRVGAEANGEPETKEQMLASFKQLSLAPTFDGTHAGPNGRAPDVVIWPEAPASFFDADPVFQQRMGEVARAANAPLIVDDISLATRDAGGRSPLYNSASFFAADGRRVGRYDKMHLVPFGEYTPYKPLFFFAGHLLDDLPFVPGKSRSLFRANGNSYGVFICYESIFGDEIRQFVKDGAQVLVNISDDGWYGDTSAPWEHLDMVRMRAIENDRWVLRATNTGITAAIDPSGRVTATMPRHARASMTASFGRIDHLTFYTRFGDWFGWLCVLVSCSAVVLSFATARNRKLEVH